MITLTEAIEQSLGCQLRPVSKQQTIPLFPEHALPVGSLLLMYGAPGMWQRSRDYTIAWLYHVTANCQLVRRSFPPTIAHASAFAFSIEDNSISVVLQMLAMIAFAGMGGDPFWHLIFQTDCV